MRTLIIGSGPIGCYLAAKLELAGEDVTLHGLGPGFERLVKQGGVFLRSHESLRGAPHVPLRCSIAPPEPQGWDLLVFAVKAQDLGRAARQFSVHAQGAITLLPQNGLPWWQFLGTNAPPIRLQSVDPGGMAESALSLRRIAGCVVTKGLTLGEDGSLVEAQVASDRFTLGDVVAGSNVVHRPAELLRRAGLPVEVSEDIRTEKWRKLLVNVAFNPLGALSHLGFGEVLDEPEGERLARLLMSEAIAVANANGLQSAINVEAALARARSSRQHKTSMLQDARAGRPLELEAILGVLLELAARSHKQVPALSTIYSCLRLLNLSLEKGPIRQISSSPYGAHRLTQPSPNGFDFKASDHSCPGA